MYNFKSLTASTKFLSYKDWKPNEYVVGKVERFSPNSKNPKYSDIVVTIIESNINTEKVTLNKNDLFTINGTTALQKAIESGIEEDDIVKVIYHGKETVKTGPWKGTQANKLEVLVAPSESQEIQTEMEIDSDDIL